MTADPWAAPLAPSPLSADVSLPGSKSVTNRALVLAALAAGPSRLVAPLRSRDTDLMVAALQALGAIIETDGDDLLVTAPIDRAATDPVRIDVGNAGTVARFLPALCALTSREVTLDGDPRIRERPVAPLVGALRRLGATVDGDALPLVVRGTGSVRGGRVEVNAAQSSQFVSGLLLAAPLFDHGVEVGLVGSMPSAQHVGMTTALMRDRGVVVREEGASGDWVVEPGAYAAGDLVVEPDLSGASAFLGAAAATGGRVTVRGWPEQTLQPGMFLPALLGAMGCQQTWDGGLTIHGPQRLVGLDADLRDAPELTPVLAVLAALATTPSRLVGVAHLRVQETDRLTALATELNRLGGDVDELPDGLVIRPAPLHGGLWRAYDDHRLAMAAAVLGLVVAGVQVDDIATTGKTMPDFPQRWAAMLEASA